MKKYLLMAAVLLLAASCAKPSAKVSLQLKDAPGHNVELYRLDINRFTLVDSLATDKNGELSYKIALASEENPAFYYLYHNATRLAGFVAKAGDNISLVADTLGHYSVEGSEESSLMLEVDTKFAQTVAKMEQILNEMPEDVNRRLSKVYIEHKRAMINQVMEHPFSITSAAACFQKFNDNLPTFNDKNDVYIFQMLMDSLVTVYPESEYVKALGREIDLRRNINQFNSQLDTLAKVGIPSIVMNDVHGKPQSIDSLAGKVVLLSFWSIEQNEHKVFNQEMKPIYEKYHNQGFEIFQVSVDSDKSAWATIVRNQQIPWISVNDGLGINTPALRSYNINSIPTMFIIGRDFDILAKDEYDPAKIEEIVKANI